MIYDYPRIPHVTINPESLGWGDFISKPERIRGQYDAEAGFAYTYTKNHFRPRTEGKLFGLTLADDWGLVVRPMAVVWVKAKQSVALLRHEDIHYLFSYVLSRALVQDLESFTVADRHQLKSQLDGRVKQHMETRRDALNEKYDDDTDHGEKTARQREWERALAECLKNNTASTLMGLPL